MSMPTELPLRKTPKCLERSWRRVHRVLLENPKQHPTSPLCYACESIFKSDKFGLTDETVRNSHKDEKDSHEDEKDSYENRWYSHHKSPEDINKAILHGCCICRTIDQNALSEVLNVSENNTAQTAYSDHYFLKYRVYENQLWINLFSKDEDRNTSINLLHDFLYKLGGDNSTEALKSITNHDSETEPKMRMVNLPFSTSSNETMDLCRYWLHTCKSNHKKCGYRYETPRFRPSRLIYIEGMNDGIIRARLDCDTFGHRSVPYLTLSHCWGTDRFFTLCKENLSSLQTRIDIPKLSKVFRDALWVTSELGFRYLWIDSLCIIQDSEEDWLKESSLMGEIYMNSFCNIAATGFSSGEQGLFVDRDKDNVMYRIVYADWNGCWKYGNEQRRGYYRLLNTLTWDKEVVRAPLNRRAWVFQERLLSPCVLHFGYHQLYFECFESHRAENLPQGISDSCFSLAALKSLHFFEDVSNKHSSSQDSISTDDWLDVSESSSDSHSLKPRNIWRHQIVKRYSTGKLTKPNDKLVAISGVAKQVRRILNDEYLAGLWQRSFVHDLLWNVDEESDIDIPETYIAPTWCWASLNAQILYEVEVVDPHPDKHEIHSTLLAAKLRYATTDDTGIVTNGSYARIQGPLHDATCGVMNTATLFYTSSSFGVDGSTGVSLRICLDNPTQYNKSSKDFSLKQDSDPSRHIYLLSILSGALWGSEDHPGTAGLIIAPTKCNRGEYERVGMFIAATDAADILKEPQSILASDLWEKNCGDGQYVITIV